MQSIGLMSGGYISTDSLADSSEFLTAISQYLKVCGYKEPLLGTNENTFTLWHNFIILNFYLLLSTVETDADSDVDVDVDVDVDAVTDDNLLNEVERMKKVFYSRLDPSIRFQLQTRGVTIIQNVYVGFDTEFEELNHSKFLNKLLSIQLAVQNRTLVKVPLYSIQDISFIHPLTSEISKSFYKPTEVNWKQPRIIKGKKEEIYNELNSINNSIKRSVHQIRKRLFKSIDTLTSNLVEKLKGLIGIKYYDDTLGTRLFLFYLYLLPNN
jgi:hypothetical protein